MRGKSQIRFVETTEDEQEVDYKDLKCRKAGLQWGLSPVRETKIMEMSELTSGQSTSTAVLTPMMKPENMDSRRQSRCDIQIDRVRSATINVPISINGQDIYVAPIGDSVLLGCDIVDALDITINSKKGIQVDGKWLECYTERKVDDQIARVVLTENVTVPINSEINIFWLEL
ncbi:unnamed protein product [Mytilus coruscus]|uniref:Uncharacterized protein n=1 Tax=Mytilus coruscus TaxID=42192 RepID=A0A6J8BEB4_MYTCO|nr:unnamed protein product [Mytilus coruscus]